MPPVNVGHHYSVGAGFSRKLPGVVGHPLDVFRHFVPILRVSESNVENIGLPAEALLSVLRAFSVIVWLA